MLIWVILFCLAVSAFGLSAVSGGGAGLLLMPLLGLIVTPAQVPAALSIGTASSSISRITAFYSNIRWDIVRYFIPAALPLCGFGAWLLTRLDPLYLEVCLAIFLIGNLPLIFFAQPIRSEKTIEGGKIFLVAIGAGAGFLSGFTGAVGLIFNRFYLRLGLRKEEIIATRAANEILLHLLKLGLYGTFGLLSTRVLLAGGILAAAAISSSYLMRMILPLVHDHVFHRLNHLAMGIAGFVMLITSGIQLAHRENIVISYVTESTGHTASMKWGHHTFTVELENGQEVEIKHAIRALDLVYAPYFSKHYRRQENILHLSTVSGIYLSSRAL
ncbi:sulfite exporter TauE/SafE family protein [Acetobacter sp.]|jgi:uncharacterized membrane protein YfcA|uniref:sulfite exporter TauE/SafE family protein n=1 Tax=Acetobacter sp. TaxID=440 RepID=UPI0025C4DFD1|nr:sulfite exporter TauE/SafE family protein [Acetobacter sp.]